MSKFQRIIKQLTGGIYVPDEALSLKGKTLLHISDTPHMIFSSLKKLIEQLKPDYIIHTGDMVDNIKLELFPYKIDEYKRSLLKLNRSLSVYKDAQLIIALGNHDDTKLVKSTFREATVYANVSIIDVEGRSIEIAHYPPNFESKTDLADISLFGHDLSVRSHTLGDVLILNGIENINLIELNTLKAITMNYPSGTDDSRLRKRKIGI